MRDGLKLELYVIRSVVIPYYSPEESRTAQQKQVLALSDTLIAELEQADEYVSGVPMHNFGVPSVLKLWIDHIARVGRTFSYADGTPKGLLKGKAMEHCATALKGN